MFATSLVSSVLLARYYLLQVPVAHSMAGGRGEGGGVRARQFAGLLPGCPRRRCVHAQTASKGVLSQVDRSITIVPILPQALVNRLPSLAHGAGWGGTAEEQDEREASGIMAILRLNTLKKKPT